MDSLLSSAVVSGRRISTLVLLVASRLILRRMPSARLYSFSDPWLGVGLQLLPLPYGLVRIAMVALPSIVLPHALTLLLRTKGARRRRSLLDRPGQSSRAFLASFLWSIAGSTTSRSTPAQCTAPPASASASTTSRASGISPVPPHGLLFTLEQVVQMHNDWLQYAKSWGVQCNGDWEAFIRRRRTAAVVDSDSNLDEDSGSEHRERLLHTSHAR